MKETPLFRAIVIICLLVALTAARRRARHWRRVAQMHGAPTHRPGASADRGVDDWARANPTMGNFTTRSVPIDRLAIGMDVLRVPIIGRLKVAADATGILDAHGQSEAGRIVAFRLDTRGGTPRMIRFDNGARVYVAADAEALVAVRLEVRRVR